MGFINRLRGRQQADHDMPPLLADAVPHQRGEAWPDQPGVVADSSDLGWYAPHNGDGDHLVGPDGIPALHLIPYRDIGGERVLHLCEDTTGLLVSPGDSRLPRAGVYVAQLRGLAFHRLGCTARRVETGPVEARPGEVPAR